MKLRVGIIGYGVVGKKRRVYIDDNPHFETICVSDICFDSKGTFPDGVKYYSNYKNIFDQDIDVIFVSIG